MALHDRQPEEVEGGQSEARLRDQGASAYTLCHHAPWRRLRLGGSLYGGEGWWNQLLGRLRLDNTQVSFAEILETVGELPIPPYPNRATEESDKTTYQTVYSKIKGSVAAPTAGLHFTDAVLQDIDRHGIEREEVTLHVGAGTFKPVKSLEIEGHRMHTEYIVVHRHTLEKLLQHHCEVIAVGTTSVRTIESLYYMGVHLLSHPEATEDDLHVNQWDPYELSADGGL